MKEEAKNKAIEALKAALAKKKIEWVIEPVVLKLTVVKNRSYYVVQDGKKRVINKQVLAELRALDLIDGDIKDLSTVNPDQRTIDDAPKDNKEMITHKAENNLKEVLINAPLLTDSIQDYVTDQNRRKRLNAKNKDHGDVHKMLLRAIISNNKTDRKKVKSLQIIGDQHLTSADKEMLRAAIQHYRRSYINGVHGGKIRTKKVKIMSLNADGDMFKVWVTSQDYRTITAYISVKYAATNKGEF